MPAVPTEARQALTMKTAVQFGAGNIGRGFLGQLFYQSGYETVFVDVVDELVEALNARGSYPLRTVDEPAETMMVRNVRAVNGRSLPDVARAVAGASIAATAVGVPVMDKIAEALAAGIALRFSTRDAPPLDIIVCENMIGAGPFMREQVRKYLPAEHHAALDERVGFVEASIGRMVPVMTDAQKAEDPLLVAVEAYCELPVDADAFKGGIPPIVHLLPRKDFGAYVERKLFVHNMSHAVTAYLGAQRGHAFIWQAVDDPQIRPVVEEAMAETCRALSQRHGLAARDLQAHARDLLRRFGNRALGDQVARVARDPIRKLGFNDRLIGAMRRCLDEGVSPSSVAIGTAAAIRYEAPDDPAAVRVQAILADEGLDAVLSDICGVPSDSEIARLVRTAFTAAAP
jgi:mannitol-1-phosphate 5-dehydrogenase